MYLPAWIGFLLAACCCCLPTPVPPPCPDCPLFDHYCDPVLYECRRCEDICVPRNLDSHHLCLVRCPGWEEAKPPPAPENGTASADGNSTDTDLTEIYDVINAYDDVTDNDTLWEGARGRAAGAPPGRAADTGFRAADEDIEYPNILDATDSACRDHCDKIDTGTAVLVVLAIVVVAFIVFSFAH